MGKWGLGVGVPRTEDEPLLRGHGRYTDDIVLPRQCYLCVLRSPHAAARIHGIDTASVRAAPGVLAVLTGTDLKKENFGTFNSRIGRHRPDGTPNPVPPFLPLAVDRVRHVGDPVAAIIAESVSQAKDAAELVDVDYEIVSSVVDTAMALEPDAPPVWDEVPDNLCFRYELGDKEAADAAFQRAHHVARQRLVITRVTSNTMEGRAALGFFDRREDRFILYAGLQSPHSMRQEIANVFKLPANKFRLIAPDVGGSFGMKASLHPELILVLWAARIVDRPVKWIAERSEAMISDHQARDNVSDVELALDENGKFLALRVNTVANLGAYLALMGIHVPTNNLGGLAGVYTIQAFDVTVSGVFTNTLPTCPYRGAGRPEASYCVERIVDVAARDLDIDRAELRRRNMIPPEAMPYQTALVYTYDVGEFEMTMDKCLQAAEWATFESRRAEALERGRLRGIGIACVIEIAGGPFDGPIKEAAEIRFDATGGATILTGGHSQGQGHATAFRQFATEFLGLSWDNVHVVYGDTDMIYHGGGTWGSRTMMAGGTAFLAAAQKVIARGKEIAGHLLEASPLDIDFTDGQFAVAGTDRRIDLVEVAKASFQARKLPAELGLGLHGDAVVATSGATYPNGCHVCEVEIDPQTGTTNMVAYNVIDDVGREVNPLLLKGQIHGGIAQGAGQALFEQIFYDRESGQILSGSFMDYGMPRADDFSFFGVGSHNVPATTNPLGIKGGGEAGTIGALPAVMSAVADALLPLGIKHIDMPATPENVWQAIKSARQHSQ